MKIKYVEVLRFSQIVSVHSGLVWLGLAWFVHSGLLVRFVLVGCSLVQCLRVFVCACFQMITTDVKCNIYTRWYRQRQMSCTPQDIDLRFAWHSVLHTLKGFCIMFPMPKSRARMRSSLTRHHSLFGAACFPWQMQLGSHPQCSNEPLPPLRRTCGCRHGPSARSPWTFYRCKPYRFAFARASQPNECLC